MVSARSHIAHILPWSTVGGTEHATLRIAQALEGEEFKSTAFCPGGPSPVREMFEANGFDTVEYRAIEPSYRHPREFVLASIRLARELRRNKVDLVHCSDLLGAYYAAFAGRLARLPVLCHVRCSFPTVSRRDQSFLRAVNKFVFVSRDAWETFGYRVPPARGVVVYDGVEVAEDDLDSEASRSVRREFELPDDMLLIGTVARVTPAKDYATLARAAARIVAVHKAVRFLIVGDHSQVALNRDHYVEVQRMLSDSGVSPYFIFADHRDDVQRLIAAMDIFVLSTHTEGLPLVILEAMAHAKPVVATDVGGVSEVVSDGETGLLHPHGDDERQAAHLLALLQDSLWRRQLGVAGQRFVKAQFTQSGFAAGMTKLYREMLGGRHWAGTNRPPEHALARVEEIK